jgi:hypothetical protein
MTLIPVFLSFYVYHFAIFFLKSRTSLEDHHSWWISEQIRISLVERILHDEEQRYCWFVCLFLCISFIFFFLSRWMGLVSISSTHFFQRTTWRSWPLYAKWPALWFAAARSRSSLSARRRRYRSGICPTHSTSSVRALVYVLFWFVLLFQDVFFFFIFFLFHFLAFTHVQDIEDIHARTKQTTDGASAGATIIRYEARGKALFYYLSETFCEG